MFPYPFPSGDRLSQAYSRSRVLKPEACKECLIDRQFIFRYLESAFCLILSEFWNFFRPTRMHSADYAVARCLSVRPSIRLSNAGILSKLETARHIIKVFSSSGSQTILLFRTKRRGNTPTGTPLMGALNARGMKNHDFRPISRFIWETMQDRAIVTMGGE